MERVLVPKISILENFQELVEQGNLLFQNLEAGTVIKLESESGSIYQLIVMNPSARKAKLRVIKSEILTGEHDVFVNGATAGGAYLVVGAIIVGFFLELLIPGEIQIGIRLTNVTLDLLPSPSQRVN